MEFTDNFSSINLLVVFGATLASNLLGGLWYSPILFGKPWRKLTKSNGDSEDILGVSAGVFIAGFVLTLVAASLLAALIGPGADGKEGARLGALIGVCFIFTSMGTTNLFERNPIQLVMIHSGFHTFSFCTMGFIIGQWS